MPHVRTDDVITTHHLMELFTGTDEADDGEYYGPDLDECGGVVLVCGGAWQLEPDGELWRFWKDPEWDD